MRHDLLTLASVLAETLPSGHPARDLRRAPIALPARQAVAQEFQIVTPTELLTRAESQTNPQHLMTRPLHRQSPRHPCLLVKRRHGSCCSIPSSNRKHPSRVQLVRIRVKTRPYFRLRCQCLMKRSESDFVVIDANFRELSCASHARSRGLASSENRDVWTVTAAAECEHDGTSGATTGLQPSRRVSEKGRQRAT